MIPVFHRSNAVTYLGVVVAAVGVVFSSVAVLCLMAAGMCDLLDGWFARRFERTEEMQALGIQLDSLSDTVGFVLLPVAIFMTSAPQPVLAVAVIAGYTLAAVSRLALFNVRAEGCAQGYRGLPTTYAALILPLAWLAARVVGWPTDWVFGSAMALLAIGFIVDIHMPKPPAKAIPAFGILALALAVAVIWVGP
ncbi:MAG: CDP-alcohol phosphatidyltransferase family protein [Propionibacteriaceae bacterium]|jgi:CDP-diacylglycerol--serine O-phosphatidyltransferase|nr:CDP-alcohol phosphatidyltransferase family protein [Propionibacteriaceae bacterium]